MKLNFFRFWIPVLAVGAAVGLTQAQDKLLAPTYQEGKSYTLDVTQNMTMDMSKVGAAMGQPGMGKTVMTMTMGMEIDCVAHVAESLAERGVVKELKETSTHAAELNHELTRRTFFHFGIAHGVFHLARLYMLI